MELKWFQNEILTNSQKDPQEQLEANVMPLKINALQTLFDSKRTNINNVNF
jgi:hypothetical protein